LERYTAGQQLAEVLKAIWQASVPRTAKLHLSRHAVEVAVSGEKADSGAGGSLLAIFEEAMASASGILGRKVGVATIRRSLLNAGQRDLAKRFEVAAKGRRLAAHPDVMLARDVAQALRGASSEPVQVDELAVGDVDLAVLSASSAVDDDGDGLVDSAVGTQHFWMGEVTSEVGIQTDMQLLKESWSDMVSSVSGVPDDCCEEKEIEAAGVFLAVEPGAVEMTEATDDVVPVVQAPGECAGKSAVAVGWKEARAVWDSTPIVDRLYFGRGDRVFAWWADQSLDGKCVQVPGRILRRGYDRYAGKYRVAWDSGGDAWADCWRMSGMR